MKTIICGSRTIFDRDLVFSVIESAPFRSQISTIFCGGASGVDVLGAAWALQNHLPIVYYRPDWVKYGKPAGIIRNMEMATYADALIAVWDGKSPGTGHMLKYIKQLDPKLQTHIHILPQTTLITQGRHESASSPQT